ncbi:MAG: hypothetical protein JXA37_07715 [Chloroflexia bacterium]|nr:hypothetical protein [Chloroflexia bacterium]
MTIDQVRARVAEKLKTLDGFVALRQTAEGTAPHLFHSGDDLSQLVLGPRYPLSTVLSLLYKHDPQAQLGIVARACDIRAMVEMAKRNQLDPERVYLLGVSCTAEEAEECHCADPVPPLEQWPQAEMIGEPSPPGSPSPLIAQYEGLSLEERRDFWQQQFIKCVKCYGCRNICPECFCEACALEDALWVEPGVLAPPFPMYHLVRAMHMASRCVSCRQCELTCPAHIPLTVLYELLRRDVGEMLGYVPGMDLEAGQPLSLSLADAPMLE